MMLFLTTLLYIVSGGWHPSWCCFIVQHQGWKLTNIMPFLVESPGIPPQSLSDPVLGLCNALLACGLHGCISSCWKDCRRFSLFVGFSFRLIKQAVLADFGFFFMALLNPVKLFSLLFKKCYTGFCFLILFYDAGKRAYNCLTSPVHILQWVHIQPACIYVYLCVRISQCAFSWQLKPWSTNWLNTCLEHNMRIIQHTYKGQSNIHCTWVTEYNVQSPYFCHFI